MAGWLLSRVKLVQSRQLLLSRLQPPADSISAFPLVHKEIYPKDDFKYDFLDESIAKFYAAEQNIGRLLKWATGLTIFISCLGLAGLVIYTSNLRVKEIGVRKVLGASVTHIVTLLSKDFVKSASISLAV